MVNEFEVDGRHGVLRVVSWGEGEVPLLAIIPVGAEWLVSAFPPDLAATFTVYVLELPGTGRSAGGTEAATVGAAIEAVRDTIDALTLENVVLFGHSMNGTLALAAAAGGVPCKGVIAVGAVPTLPPDADLSAVFWEEKAEPGRKEAAAAAEAAFDAATSDGEKLVAWQAYNNVRRWYDPAVDRSDLDTTGNVPQGWIQAVFDDVRRWTGRPCSLPSSSPSCLSSATTTSSPRQLRGHRRCYRPRRRSSTSAARRTRPSSNSRARSSPPSSAGWAPELLNWQNT